MESWFSEPISFFFLSAGDKHQHRNFDEKWLSYESNKCILSVIFARVQHTIQPPRYCLLSSVTCKQFRYAKSFSCSTSTNIVHNILAKPVQKHGRFRCCFFADGNDLILTYEEGYLFSQQISQLWLIE